MSQRVKKFAISCTVGRAPRTAYCTYKVPYGIRHQPSWSEQCAVTTHLVVPPSLFMSPSHAVRHQRDNVTRAGRLCELCTEATSWRSPHDGTLLLWSPLALPLRRALGSADDTLQGAPAALLGAPSAALAVRILPGGLHALVIALGTWAG